MTRDESDSIKALRDEFEEFRLNFWKRIAVGSTTLVFTVGGTLIAFGIWIGGMEASIQRGAERDAETRDHDKRIALVEAALLRMEPGISVIPRMESTIERMRRDLTELREEARRQQRNRQQ